MGAVRKRPKYITEGAITMSNVGSSAKGYILAAALGAITGGIVVALATKAIPKMMSQMMAGMMQRMMSQGGVDGCTPAEI